MREVAYQRGSYVRELRADHRLGKHEGEAFAHCPECGLRIPSDFSSVEDFFEKLGTSASELEQALLEHELGAHEDSFHSECVECVVREHERSE